MRTPGMVGLVGEFAWEREGTRETEREKRGSKDASRAVEEGDRVRKSQRRS